MTHALPAHFQPPPAAVVALGASAGGIDALLTLLQHVPVANGPSVLIVVHLPPRYDRSLAEIFSFRLALAVREAQPHAPLEPSTVYFAPAGYHLLVEADRTLSLSCEPPVMYSRPSIDVMMQSCADAFGPLAVGVILTGANEDGAHGLACIKSHGGLAVVQEPSSAAYAVMPAAAIARAQPDFILPLEGISRLLSVLRMPA